jgi:hypothetical protein
LDNATDPEQCDGSLSRSDDDDDARDDDTANGGGPAPTSMEAALQLDVSRASAVSRSGGDDDDDDDGGGGYSSPGDTADESPSAAAEQPVTSSRAMTPHTAANMATEQEVRAILRVSGRVRRGSGLR